MQSINLKRCKHHGEREAAARCPHCKYFFCRECITDHDEKVLCIHCLKKLLIKTNRKKFNIGILMRPFLFLGGSFMVFLFFYYMGLLLIRIPAKFHEGTFWSENFWGM